MQNASEAIECLLTGHDYKHITIIRFTLKLLTYD